MCSLFDHLRTEEEEKEEESLWNSDLALSNLQDQWMQEAS